GEVELGGESGARAGLRGVVHAGPLTGTRREEDGVLAPPELDVGERKEPEPRELELLTVGHDHLCGTLRHDLTLVVAELEGGEGGDEPAALHAADGREPVVPGEGVADPCSVSPCGAAPQEMLVR